MALGTQKLDDSKFRIWSVHMSRFDFFNRSSMEFSSRSCIDFKGSVELSRSVATRFCTAEQQPYSATGGFAAGLATATETSTLIPRDLEGPDNLTHLLRWCYFDSFDDSHLWPQVNLKIPSWSTKRKLVAKALESLDSSTKKLLVRAFMLRSCQNGLYCGCGRSPSN